MASTINATSTGSGGLITTGNSVNQLELQTGDTTRVVIDSSGNVTIQGQGDLRLADSDSSHYVALQAPGTVASNVTFTLPSADGTSGQVLQTNGSGTLSFATPSGGSLIYIASATASTSATLDFTNIGSTYDAYMFTFTKLVPSSSGTEMLMRTSTNNGSSYDSGGTDYSWSGTATYNGNTNVAAGNTGTSYIWLCGVGASSNNSATQGGINGVLYLYKPSAAAYCVVQGQFAYTTNSSQYGQNIIGGQRQTAADVDAVRFYMGSGDITSGVIRLYGIKNS